MRFVRGKGNHMKIWYKSVAGMTVSADTLRLNKLVLLKAPGGSCGWMWLLRVKEIDFRVMEVGYRCSVPF